MKNRSFGCLSFEGGASNALRYRRSAPRQQCQPAVETETYLVRTLSSGGPWLPTLPRTGLPTRRKVPLTLSSHGLAGGCLEKGRRERGNGGMVDEVSVVCDEPGVFWAAGELLLSANRRTSSAAHQPPIRFEPLPGLTHKQHTHAQAQPETHARTRPRRVVCDGSTVTICIVAKYRPRGYRHGQTAS